MKSYVVGDNILGAIYSTDDPIGIAFAFSYKEPIFPSIHPSYQATLVHDSLQQAVLLAPRQSLQSVVCTSSCAPYLRTIVGRFSNVGEAWV
jgi:hypothetical protein